ncbi:hypothetical protein AB6A40_001875 [Gnathostoma spinigerum]|uniref:asparaginase n=1 Tax=Gnathostoma spinigerum TaxID=75299 RepID=A0ABD6E7M5_9BILA
MPDPPAIPVVKTPNGESLKTDNATTSAAIDESHLPKKLMLDTGSMVKAMSATQLVSRVSKDLDAVKSPKSSSNTYAVESRLLVLYTGGTIGMKTIDGVYQPVAAYLPKAIRDLPPLNDKEYIEQNYDDAKVKPYCLPPVRHMKKRIVYWVVEYSPLLDSSDMTFDDWIRIGTDIRKSYQQYDGFVVLHGTDTLAYTACALSFMLENLGKPVIITGAQIPVSEVRSDGRENLIGALIIAGNFDIPEVTVYFNNTLMRGNRCTKLDNSALDAFVSPNMAPLARMDIHINVNYESIFRSPFISPFKVHDKLCRNIGLLRIFPSISLDLVKALLQPPTQGVVLQTFGAGNMPSRRTDIIQEIKAAIDRGCIIVNCSQCVKGQVDVHYHTGKILYDVGVIPASDMTTEAALIKLSYVLGKDEWDLPMKRKMMQRNIRGEMTISTPETLHELEIFPRLAKFLRIGSSDEMQLLRKALYPPLLCHAAMNGDVDLLENLRESGALFSSADYNGRTALHVAAGKGHFNVVKYLIKHGCNVHSKDQWDENPLRNAIRSKNLQCIKVLVDAGAHLSCTTSEIGMELCLAASRVDFSALDAWFAAGADVNASDYDGRTALHIAANSENETMIAYLLEHGADPRLTDRCGETPLIQSERRNDIKAVDLMRKKLQNEAFFAFN